MMANSRLISPFSVLLADLPDADVDMFSTSCAASVEGGGCVSALCLGSWDGAAVRRRPLDAEVMMAGGSSRRSRGAEERSGRR